jgi:hypothetical protein
VTKVLLLREEEGARMSDFPSAAVTQFSNLPLSGRVDLLRHITPLHIIYLLRSLKSYLGFVTAILVPNVIVKQKALKCKAICDGHEDSYFARMKPFNGLSWFALPLVSAKELR